MCLFSILDHSILTPGVVCIQFLCLLKKYLVLVPIRDLLNWNPYSETIGSKDHPNFNAIFVDAFLNE